MRSFRRPQHRQFALWLALAAVLLRALLPDGMMLERAGSGGIALAICYASPLAKLRADQGQPQQSHVQGECAFAAAAGAALPSAPQAYAPAAAAAASLASQLLPERFSAFAGGRPPARAPPAVS